MMFKSKAKKALLKNKKIIEKSGMFDSKFYLKIYHDARIASETPLDHFIKIGLNENRKPNDEFDPVWYREYYLDVKENDINPFIHYILYGKVENRYINNTKVFMMESNLIQNEEVADVDTINQRADIPILERQILRMNRNSERDIMKANNIESFQYMLSVKKDEITSRFINATLKRQRFSPFKILKEISELKSNLSDLEKSFKKIPRRFLEKFDAGKYLKCNKDVFMAIENGEFENALEHFILFGYEEVKGGVRQLYSQLLVYNEEDYLKNYPDIQKAVDKKDFKNGYEHFLKFGHIELLNASRMAVNNITEKLDLKLIDPHEMLVSYNMTIDVPKFEKPLVSIVIPAYNQANYTLACIQAIVEHTSTIAYEIILMDDKSPDEEARNLNHFIKNITFVSNEKNLGFLLNCNKGASLAKGKYILLLNNDTNVQPNWLTSLVDLMESDKKIGMVGSRLVYPDGRQQEAGGIIWNDASGWNFGRLDDPLKPEYNYIKEVDYISGASIMIKSDLWKTIGGFDERYKPAYYEDSDLAFEVRNHGYTVMYQPKSIVVHFEGISNGTDLGSGIKKYQVINYQKFFDKWRIVLENEHFPNAENVFYARDRSQNKEHILVIDHYVPHYDKDAGSRTMWQYLFMLTEMGYKVTFVGDNYFKHEPYTSELESIGVEVLYGPYYYHHFSEWLKDNGHYFDFVYLLRPHISIKYIDAIVENTAAKIFYNGTDFHFLRMEREYSLTKDSTLLPLIEEIKKDELNLFEKSDCVLTISDYEREYFEKHFPQWDVKTIPTYVYKESFPLSPNWSFDNREGILFVGGFTHKPNEVGVQWFLDEIWEKIISKNPKMKFYIVGSNMPEKILSYANANIIPKGFVEDSELAELYNNVKLVVAPLTFGAGVKGKIIESICHGVPVITTSIGAEGIKGAEDILSITDDENQFADNILELYSNKIKWEEIRRAEIKYAENNFAYESAKKLIENIFVKDNK